MELLAPAGTLQKLRYAVLYGANAVYAALPNFSLRAKAGNLTKADLAEALEFCHQHHSKLYLTLNAYMMNDDLDGLAETLQEIKHLPVDGVIVADPAVVRLVQRLTQFAVHLSTQANVTNWQTAKFWYEEGVSRIILARELNFSQICEIKQHNPSLQVEIFVHGAMCISYSGRCLLSAFLNQRSANQGLCTHPCRWQYAVQEGSRPGQYFPLDEDERGTYIFNSKDLCLFDRIPALVNSGIDSLKIEGRMKSLYYVANCTRIYREAIDSAINGIPVSPSLAEELDKISHRPYSEAFFANDPNQILQHYQTSAYSRDYQYLGSVYQVEDRAVYIDVVSKFTVGETIEIIYPNHKEDYTFCVNAIEKDEGLPVEAAQPNQKVKLILDRPSPLNGILRKKLP